MGTATGVGVYARDLAAALRAAGTDVRALAAPRLDPWRFDRRVLWDQVLLPLAAARSGAAVLHATSGTMPLLRTLPTVVTVHDVAWLRVQSHTRAYARAYFGALQNRAYRGAAAIVCDSQFTRRRVPRADRPRRAASTSCTPASTRASPRSRAAPTPSPFALVVGTVEARKNLLVLIDALAALPHLRIVSVGPHTPYAERVRVRAIELGVSDRIELRGYVSARRSSTTSTRARPAR